jgi:hypothetical protein
MTRRNDGGGRQKPCGWSRVRVLGVMIAAAIAVDFIEGVGGGRERMASDDSELNTYVKRPLRSPDF